MKSRDQMQRGFTDCNEGREEGGRIIAGVPINPSFLSTLQPKRRTHNRHTHTLCQPFHAKFKILIWPREGNLVVGVMPDQPTGDL